MDQYSTPPEKEEKEPPRPLPVTKAEKRRHPIQDELDLHGLTMDEARKLLEGFVKDARQQRFKKIVIIHGRGIHSDGDAVLKPMVQEWAKNQKKLSFETCSPAQGGSGATWFWLE